MSCKFFAFASIWQKLMALRIRFECFNKIKQTIFLWLYLLVISLLWVITKEFMDWETGPSWPAYKCWSAPRRMYSFVFNRFDLVLNLLLQLLIWQIMSYVASAVANSSRKNILGHLRNLKMDARFAANYLKVRPTFISELAISMKSIIMANFFNI